MAESYFDPDNSPAQIRQYLGRHFSIFNGLRGSQEALGSQWGWGGKMNVRVSLSLFQIHIHTFPRIRILF